MKLTAKQKPATQAVVEEARPAAEPVQEAPPKQTRDAAHVLHLRCRESTQIGPFGQSLDEDRSSTAHDIEMTLKPELGGVEVQVNINALRRCFLVPMNLIAHIELEPMGAATKPKA